VAFLEKKIHMQREGGDRLSILLIYIREYIPTLQARQKWPRPQRDIREGDIVLVAQENIQRGQWPLGRVVTINVGRDGHTRSCVVKTIMSQFIRPITKLCLLECSI
jgi:hypothetical protein